jgi:NADPH2:quinone reductase
VNQAPYPQVDRCFPLEQAVEGHDYLEAGKSRGKVLYEI